MRLWPLLALAACGKQHDAGPIDHSPHRECGAAHPGKAGACEREAAQGLFEQLPLEAPPGMSDLTLDDRGVMWAIAERDRQVLEIELADTTPRITAYPLDGVPPGVDTEGIAWLGEGRFAIGAEGAHTATAAILFGELRDKRLVITHTRALSSADLGVELTANHGIEAVCGTSDDLLAASETVGTLPDGTRYAPLVRLRGDALAITKVRLTSDRGKLSALHCTFDDSGAAQVIAIERHFGVARILRFTLGRDEAEVTPAIDLDLYPILRDALNLEGIVRLRDGRLVVINDNQSKAAKGPTQLLVFAPR